MFPPARPSRLPFFENCQRRSGSRAGLALREIVVVVACFGLGGLLLALWISQQRVSEQRLLCESRQQTIAKALMQFERGAGHYPGFRNPLGDESPEATTETTPQSAPAEGGVSWVTAVLPAIGPVRRAAPAEMDLPQEQAPNDNPPPGRYAALQREVLAAVRAKGALPVQRIPELICSAHLLTLSAEQAAGWGNRMSFVVNAGMPDAPSTAEFPPDWPANGMFLDYTARPPHPDVAVTAVYIEYHDGLNFTLMLTENLDAGDWTSLDEAEVAVLWQPAGQAKSPAAQQGPLRINQQAGAGPGGWQFARPSSAHPGGVNVVFANGRTQFLSDQIDPLVYARLLSCDGAGVKYPGSDQPVESPYRTPAAAK